MQRLQRFTNFLLKYRWMALVLTFVSTFIPVVGVLGILIAALMTLLRGALEGAMFTFAATLPYVIGLVVTGKHDAAMPLVAWAAVGVAVLSNVVTWAFGVMLKRRMTWSTSIEIAALMGVLVVSVVHLAYPNVMEWWGSQLLAYSQQAQATLKGAADAMADSRLESINIARQYATGVMTVAVLVNGIFQLIVARWWQAILYSPGMLRRELHHIRLSRMAGMLFMMSLVLAYMGNAVVLDMMPILYVLFAAAGLSLIHYMFGMMRSPTVWFWLLLMYAGLLFAMPASLVVVSAIALLDVWLDLRKRFVKN